MKHSLNATECNYQTLSLSFELDNHLLFWKGGFNDGEIGLGFALGEGYENKEVK